MMTTGQAMAVREAGPVQRIRAIVNSRTVSEQINAALGEAAPMFVASLADLYGSDSSLQKCEPMAVVREALKAATLRLPINKSLGFAYVVPYKGAPTFQMGYRGYVQLAQRTGQYRCINADAVRQGETVTVDRLTGEVTISGAPDGPAAEPIGYFAHMELVSGFRKTLFWTSDKVREHAQRYSQSYRSGRQSPWQTHPEEMAIKTVLSHLLRKWGILSVEMQRAIDEDLRGAEADRPEEPGEARPVAADLGAVLRLDERTVDAEEREIAAEALADGAEDEQP